MNPNIAATVAAVNHIGNDAKRLADDLAVLRDQVNIDVERGTLHRIMTVLRDFASGIDQSVRGIRSNKK